MWHDERCNKWLLKIHHPWFCVILIIAIKWWQNGTSRFRGSIPLNKSRFANLPKGSFPDCHVINQLWLFLSTLPTIVNVLEGDRRVANWFAITALWFFFPPKLLSRKDKTTFEKLEYVMSKEDNYKRLRDYISSLKMTPCIPYLGKTNK